MINAFRDFRIEENGCLHYILNAFNNDIEVFYTCNIM